MIRCASQTTKICLIYSVMIWFRLSIFYLQVINLTRNINLVPYRTLAENDLKTKSITYICIALTNNTLCNVYKITSTKTQTHIHKTVVWLEAGFKLTGRKTRQPIRMHVDAQWVDRCHQNVQPQIEFAAIDQQWPIHIALHNQRLPFRYLRPSVDHPNAGASRWCWRLDDPLGVVLTVARPNYAQLFQIVGQNVGARHETELFFAMSHHLRFEIAPQTIFATDLERSGYVVDFLIRAQRFEARTFHMFAPDAHPVVGVWPKDEERDLKKKPNNYYMSFIRHFYGQFDVEQMQCVLEILSFNMLMVFYHHTEYIQRG